MADITESFLLLYSSVHFYLSEPPVLQSQWFMQLAKECTVASLSLLRDWSTFFSLEVSLSSHALMWSTSNSDNLYHVSSRDERISETQKKEMYSLVYVRAHTQTLEMCLSPSFSGLLWWWREELFWKETHNSVHLFLSPSPFSFIVTIVGIFVFKKETLRCIIFLAFCLFGIKCFKTTLRVSCLWIKNDKEEERARFT